MAAVGQILFHTEPTGMEMWKSMSGMPEVSGIPNSKPLPESYPTVTGSNLEIDR
jgi:hypothetical protein